MMQLNHLERFRSIIESGRTAYGCVLASTAAGLAELAGEAGFDFVWIDLEHSPLTITDVKAGCDVSGKVKRKRPLIQSATQRNRK